MEIIYFEFLQFRKSFELLHSRQEVKETLSCEKYPSLKMQLINKNVVYQINNHH